MPASNGARCRRPAVPVTPVSWVSARPQVAVIGPPNTGL